MRNIEMAQKSNKGVVVSTFASHMIPTLIESSLPFITYIVIKSTLHTSDLVALSIGALIPAGLGITRFVRQRRLDVVNLLIMVGIVGSIIAALIGGDPRILLIRESAVGVLIGIAFLVSLAFPQPLLFSVIRQIRAGNDVEKVAAFNRQWEDPARRRAYRLLTLMWGLGTLGEFALRVVLVLTLPIPVVLGLSTIVFPAIYALLALVTILSLYRLKK